MWGREEFLHIFHARQFNLKFGPNRTIETMQLQEIQANFKINLF